MDQDSLKRSAAQAALEIISGEFGRDTIIGVGTGSTANCFVDLLATEKHRFDATVASSAATTQRLENHGIRVVDINAAPEIAVYVDGADEIDPNRVLIKGGGGALTREKIVAASSERFVCIADLSKKVAVLGAYPLPVEVIPMARGLVARKLAAVGGEPIWRRDFVTDNGNHILDVHGLRIDEPAKLEAYINNMVGTVCNGVFAAQAADTVVFAGPEGIELLDSDAS